MTTTKKFNKLAKKIHNTSTSITCACAQIHQDAMNKTAIQQCEYTQMHTHMHPISKY